mgnify:FL=1
MCALIDAWSALCHTLRQEPFDRYIELMTSYEDLPQGPLGEIAILPDAMQRLFVHARAASPQVRFSARARLLRRSEPRGQAYVNDFYLSKMDKPRREPDEDDASGGRRSPPRPRLRGPTAPGGPSGDVADNSAAAAPDGETGGAEGTEGANTEGQEPHPQGEAAAVPQGSMPYADLGSQAATVALGAAVDHVNGAKVGGAPTDNAATQPPCVQPLPVPPAYTVAAPRHRVMLHHLTLCSFLCLPSSPAFPGLGRGCTVSPFRPRSALQLVAASEDEGPRGA